MKGTQFFTLERLVAHFGLSKPAVIERLIDWADDTLTKSLYDDEAAFNRYIDRARSVLAPTLPWHSPKAV
jgi:hypothetical protein